MTRHTRQFCKIANSDEGMAQLMDHTLQKQVTALQTQIMAQSTQIAKVDTLQAQVAELTALLKGQLVTSETETGSGAQRSSGVAKNKTKAKNEIAGSRVQVNAHTIVHNQVNQTINIVAPVGLRSFDAEDRLIIPAALVKAAFTENARLASYCKLSDEEKTDAEAAAPYVLEALMELVKRAHKDPLSRNVYLNPKRADQALVFVDSDDVKTWEVRPLLEAIRRIFDTVAGGIHRVIVTDAERAQLPFEVQSSASWIPNLYDDEPDKYVKEAKQPMSAHLTNTRPIPPVHAAALEQKTVALLN
jgi:hypothetical protein